MPFLITKNAVLRILEIWNSTSSLVLSSWCMRSMSDVKQPSTNLIQRQPLDFYKVQHQNLNIPETREGAERQALGTGWHRFYTNPQSIFNLSLILTLSAEVSPSWQLGTMTFQIPINIWLWLPKKSLGSIILLFLYNLKQILYLLKIKQSTFTHTSLFTKHPIKSYLILPLLKIPSNWYVKYPLH